MKLSLWRESFQKYLQGVVVVDTWSLDDPTEDLVFSQDKPWSLGANSVGFLPPMKNVDLYLTSPKEARGRGTQELFILVRFDRNLKYHELPINKLEGFWVTLSTLITVNWNKILPADLQAAKGLVGVSVVAQDFPVSLAPSGEAKSDWIATLSFSWFVEWLVELETGSIVDPYIIKEVRGNIYRSHLEDFQNKVLDFSGLIAPSQGVITLPQS